MAVLNPTETGIGDKVRKKVGFPPLYGEREYGKCRYGEPATHYGIYQIRTYSGEQVQVKEKFYTPTNPQTEPQQTNRSKFSTAIASWQALTELQQASYNIRAKYKNYSGYNLYISEYMLS